jgi:hypothetical protein
MQPPRLRLSPRYHTGKLLPHHHTSYGALTALLVMVGLTITLISLAVVTPGSADSGDIAVTGIVLGPPPSTAPVILAPTDGTQTSNQLITVSGTCSAGLTVVVNDNQTGRGSAICDQNGAFSLAIDLTTGSNALTAYHLDDLNQSGPSSNTITVTYQPAEVAVTPGTPSPSEPIGAGLLTSPTSSSSTGTQFFVTAPYRFDGIESGQTFTLHGNLTGGTPPYALQIDWGDGSQTLVSRVAAGAFTAVHTYAKPGQFTIKLTASDLTGQTAYYQTTATVGGVTAAKPTRPPSTKPVVPAYKLAIIWPLFLVACLTVFSFWLGEFYDRKHRQPPAPLPPTSS